MPLSLQLGYPDVPRSVTNPYVNSNDALDVSDPMPFLTFIKLINVSFEPDSLQSYYNFYLTTWNTNHNSQYSDNKSIIIERYRDFLKEISVNYTTLEEKQFLSKIDFDDPYDLDIAMSFYGEKLKELILFYNNKRNDIKFNTVRKKLVGTNFGTEKTIQELTLSYLKNYDDGKMLFDFDKIKQNLEIEIEELYDAYPKYYNQTPDAYKYDNKDLDYGYDIFLKDDAQLIDEIFSNISEEMKQIKEVDQLFENKRKLTQKYISTDFYYLSTGNTTSDLVSGKLFDADNEILNFLNKQYPTTTSTTQKDYLQSKYGRGFFRPNKTSIIILDGVTKSFKFNTDNLTPNSLYYFPDPTIIGENGNILTFEVDTSFLKRNVSSGSAVNQPYSTPYDIKYNGYVSPIDPNKTKYLNSIFDSGFIQDSKKDIYGNLFGLFKDDHRFRKNIEIVSPEKTYHGMFLNGYTFYDEIFGENWNFNYTTVGSLDDIYRSGLYTNTGGFNNYEVNVVIDFGRYFLYAEPIYDSVFSPNTEIPVIEGAFFTKYDSTPYPDSSSSDLSSYEFDTGNFYYTDLIECGLYDSDPIQRALLSPLLSANFTEYIRGSSLNVVDGYHFYQSPEIKYDSLQFDQYAYDDTVLNCTVMTLSTYNYVDNADLYGKIFIKNGSTTDTLSLLDTMPYLQYKYDSDIVNELSKNIVNFDITNDIIFIKTKTYLIIEKISFDTSFKDSKTAPLYLSESMDGFRKISNVFKHDSFVYYSRLNTIQPTVSSNNFIIYPEIYKFDTINFKQIQVYPKKLSDISEMSDFFSVSGVDIRYVLSDHPKLTYSSKSNTYSVSFILKDQNNMPCLHEFDYYLNPDAIFLKHNINKFIDCNNSTIFTNISNISIYLSSNTPTIIGEELTL
jgi:hypothetical protein